MNLNTQSTRLMLGIIAVLLIMIPSSPAFALSTRDVVSAGSIWFETTIAVAMVLVTAMAFSLQIARGYFVRVLNKFTLRLGADIWWLAYVLIRDALIFLSFVMGLLVFFPGTFLDYPIAVPFMPASVVLFGLALLIKLYFDADDDRNAFRTVTALVFGGAILWIFGVVFITETPLALSTLPPGVSGSSGFWYSIYNTFSSRTNLGLAMDSFYSAFAALGLIALVGFAHPFLHSRLPKLKKVPGSPTTTVPPTAAPVTRISRPQEAPASPQEGGIQGLPEGVQTLPREKVGLHRVGEQNQGG